MNLLLAEDSHLMPSLISLKIKKDMPSAEVVIGTLVVNQGDVKLFKNLFLKDVETFMRHDLK